MNEERMKDSAGTLLVTGRDSGGGASRMRVRTCEPLSRPVKESVGAHPLSVGAHLFGPPSCSSIVTLWQKFLQKSWAGFFNARSVETETTGLFCSTDDEKI